MTHDTAAAEAKGRQIVYVREVAVTDLPADVQAQIKGVDSVYAIGSESGEQLALVKDRDLAFVVARQNDMTPVSVH